MGLKMGYKAPHEIEEDIKAYIRTFPAVPVRDLNVGDLFVIPAPQYAYQNRDFGFCNNNTCRVLKKLPTQIKYACAISETENCEEVIIMTFKQAEKKFAPILRRATLQCRDRIGEFLRKLEDARYAAERRVKNARDVYVIWNYDSEQIDSAHEFHPRTSEGFVLEVFNGNGKLTDRVRMMSDNGLDCADNTAIERMVRAYAAQYFNHNHVRNESVFRVQQCEQMD